MPHLLKSRNQSVPEPKHPKKGISRIWRVGPRAATFALSMACAALSHQARADGNGTPESDASCPAELPGTLGLPPLPYVETSESGWTAGTFNVTSAGDAAYTIPLAVPPGRAGLAPSLAIAYSSAGGDGLLGRGFSLSGQSSISRCPKNIEFDGEAHAVAYDDTDVYCLDGQRLILASDDGENQEYRTIPDSHVRIVAFHNSDVEGPAYFRLDEASGLQKWYGLLQDSRALARNRYAASWSLSAISDHRGNGIQYQYQNTIVEEPNYGGSATVSYTQEHFLTAIRYTSPGPQRSIEFRYESLPPRHSYSAHMDYVQSRRLQSISMFGPDHEFVREYNLSYNGSDVPSSRLTQVQECADGWLNQTFGRRCLTPTKFKWNQASDPGFVRIPTSVQLLPNTKWIMADVNGDGLDDVVMSNNVGAPTISVALGTGELTRPFQKAFPWATIVDPPEISSPYSIYPTDLDNDGLTDLVLQHEDDNSARVRWLRAVPGTSSGGLPHFDLLDTNIPRGPNDSELNEAVDGENNLLLGDFDGDGATDVLRCNRHDITYIDASDWEPGDTFRVQLGNKLYSYDEDALLYRNQGSAAFSYGGLAISTSCEDMAKLVVAPIVGNGKAAIVNDNYGWVYQPTPYGVALFYGFSNSLFDAHYLSEFGSPFETETTWLPVLNDLGVNNGGNPAHYDPVVTDQKRHPVVADFNGDGLLDSLVLRRTLRPCLPDEASRGTEDQGEACWYTHAVVGYGKSPLRPAQLTWTWGTLDTFAVHTAETHLPAPRSIVKSLIDQAIPFHHDDDNMADVLFPLNGSCSFSPDRTCYVVLRSNGNPDQQSEIIPTDIQYRWDMGMGEYQTPTTNSIATADVDGNGRADVVSMSAKFEGDRSKLFGGHAASLRARPEA